MNRISFGGRMAGVFVVSFLLFGCGKTEPKTEGRVAADTPDEKPHFPSGEDLSSPEKTLAALKAAGKSHDYSKLCGYFTPTARKTLAAGMVMLGGFLQAAPEAPPKADGNDSPETGKPRKLAEEIKGVFEKHGLTDANRPKVNIKLNDPKEKQDEQLRMLADPIKDHCQFFADFVKVMREQGGQPDAQMIEDDARLEGLKIDGEKAAAEFVQMRKGSEKRSPIEFELIDGQWLISEVPDLLN